MICAGGSIFVVRAFVEHLHDPLGRRRRKKKGATKEAVYKRVRAEEEGRDGKKGKKNMIGGLEVGEGLEKNGESR